MRAIRRIGSTQWQFLNEKNDFLTDRLEFKEIEVQKNDEGVWTEKNEMSLADTVATADLRVICDKIIVAKEELKALVTAARALEGCSEYGESVGISELVDEKPAPLVKAKGRSRGSK